MRQKIGSVWVYGEGLDGESRCQHYHTERDIVAIKFFCCGQYWACYECHQALASHPARPWPKERRDEAAILCGVCGTEHTINTYLNCQFQCPTCLSRFNQGCVHHYPLYFEW
jgi:uncharacterized CHY-type Zn-finger protein